MRERTLSRSKKFLFSRRRLNQLRFSHSISLGIPMLHISSGSSIAKGKVTKLMHFHQTLAERPLLHYQRKQTLKLPLPHLASFNSRQEEKWEEGGGTLRTTLINKAATGSCHDVQLGITNDYHRVQRESYSSPRPATASTNPRRRFVNFKRKSTTMSKALQAIYAVPYRSVQFHSKRVQLVVEAPNFPGF